MAITALSQVTRLPTPVAAPLAPPVESMEILQLKQEHELKMMAMKHQFQLAKIEEMKLQLQIAKLSSPTKNIMSASDAHDDDSFTF